MDPEELIREISYKMKPDGVYVADVGQNQIWSCAFHVVREGRFLTSGGMGTMGYSIPAAMGAKLGEDVYKRQEKKKAMKHLLAHYLPGEDEAFADISWKETCVFKLDVIKLHCKVSK